MAGRGKAVPWPTPDPGGSRIPHLPGESSPCPAATPCLARLGGQDPGTRGMAALLIVLMRAKQVKVEAWSVQNAFGSEGLQKRQKNSRKPLHLNSAHNYLCHCLKSECSHVWTWVTRCAVWTPVAAVTGLLPWHPDSWSPELPLTPVPLARPLWGGCTGSGRRGGGCAVSKGTQVTSHIHPHSCFQRSIACPWQGLICLLAGK